MNNKSFAALLISAYFLMGTLGAETSSAQPQPSGAPHYVVTDLGTLPGGSHSAANGINNAGQVVGWSDAGGPEPPDAALFSKTVFIHNHAVLWDHGQPQDLGLLKGFPFSSARTINSRGQVIGGWESRPLPGYMDDGGYSARQEFLWQHGRRIVWPEDKPPYLEAHTAINDKGAIVGRGPAVEGILGYSQSPLLLQAGVLKDLGLLSGADQGSATGINNSGEIVGWVSGESADERNTYYRAFAYRDGKMTNLDPVPIGSGSYRDEAWAYAINDKGQIVGVTGGAGTLWEKDKKTLFYFPGDANTTAYAINDRGQVVGTADDDNYLTTRAFLYDGAVYDLNDLIPANSGWVLKDARGINDKGQIVGSGTHDGQDRAFLLTHVSRR